MFKKGSLKFDVFLDIRESFHSKLFRAWFLDPNIETNEVYFELLKDHKLSDYMNVIKWIVPTIIGCVSAPLVGISASATESFFISKILEGWNPNLFLDDVLSRKLNILENKFELENQREIMLQRFKNIDRNVQCPCQSGKKFKRCHGMDI